MEGNIVTRDQKKIGVLIQIVFAFRALDKLFLVKRLVRSLQVVAGTATIRMSLVLIVTIEQVSATALCTHHQCFVSTLTRFMQAGPNLVRDRGPGTFAYNVLHRMFAYDNVIPHFLEYNPYDSKRHLGVMFVIPASRSESCELHR
jgi:hypothetical protein